MNSVLKARLFFVLELLLLLTIIFAVLIPFSPLSHSLPSRDSGVFLYTGWRVLNGEVPYLHVWDHKPPVIYYLDAIGLWLTPDSLWGVWCVEVVLLLVAALAGYVLLKSLFGLFPALFLSFLWLFSAFFMLAGGNLTTEYALPFQFSILWLFYRAENEPQYGWRGFMLGALTALLFFTRQNAVAIPIAIGLYLVVSRSLHAEFQRLFNDTRVILAGGLLVTALIVGYFAIKGALPAFWDTAFLYNFAYADERVASERLEALAQGLNQLENIGLAQLAFLGWGGALALLTYKKERIPAGNRALFWAAIAALPLELLLVGLAGRPRIPYFLVLLPVMAVLAGFTIWLVFTTLSRDIPRYAGALLVFIMVLSLGSVFWADYSELTRDVIQFSAEPEIVKYIRKNSGPEDFVLMWGAEAAYNFEVRRASPSRFVYQTALYNQKSQSNVTEFLQGILAQKPRLIVLNSEDRLSDFRFAYRDNQIGALMDQVKTLYAKSEKVENWVVYFYSGD